MTLTSRPGTSSEPGLRGAADSIAAPECNAGIAAPSRNAPPALHDDLGADSPATASAPSVSRERGSRSLSGRRHAVASSAIGGTSRSAFDPSALGTSVAPGVVASPLRNVAATPKPYLYAEELAELTPWSVEAINAKVKRGELRQNVHYFQECGRGRRIFKWSAIVDAIEGRESGGGEATTRPGVETDVAKATAELHRLLG